MKGLRHGWLFGIAAGVLGAAWALGAGFSTTPGGRTTYNVATAGAGPDTVSVAAEPGTVEAQDSTAHPEADNPGSMEGPEMDETSATWRGRHSGYGVAYTLSGIWKDGAGGTGGGDNRWTSHYDYTEAPRISLQVTPSTIALSKTADAKVTLHGGAEGSQYTVTLTGVDPTPTTQPVASLAFPEGSSITLTTSNRSETKKVRGDTVGYAGVDASSSSVQNSPVVERVVVKAPAVSYLKIVGLDATGKAESHIKVDPTVKYTKWQQTLDTRIADFDEAPGTAGTIKMEFDQNRVKESLPPSELVGSVFFAGGLRVDTETTGHLTRQQGSSKGETLWFHFFGEGIGIRAFPSSIHCKPTNAHYDVPSSGFVKCVAPMNERSVSSTLNLTALVQLGLNSLRTANGQLTPNERNVKWDPVGAQILPPNVVAVEGGPEARWWYSNDGKLTVAWLVTAVTPAGVVPGISVNNTITMDLP